MRLQPVLTGHLRVTCESFASICESLMSHLRAELASTCEFVQISASMCEFVLFYILIHR